MQTRTLAIAAALLLLLLQAFAVARCHEQADQQAEEIAAADESEAAVTNCNCDLPNNWHFLRLSTDVYEHSMPPTFTIDTTPLPCSPECVVFDSQPDAADALPQGNWTIERGGVIRFLHNPHKTGVAELGITIEEVSQDSDYIVNATYRINIQEDPDRPIVFASQRDRAFALKSFDNTSDQFKNLSLTVEQNTGNNVVYADLLFTAGVFDYDADERHAVHLEASETAVKGVVLGLDANSSATVSEPEDCQDEDSDRLSSRNITRWDVSLLSTHPCQLSIPYPPGELTWFTHLVRYVPRVNQSGADVFALTYTDKYRLQSKLYVNVYILVNPCINEGVCRGPSTDPQCRSRVRADGFFNRGYQCQCLPGWVGDTCEIDFDDCASSPCPAPYVCVDKFRGFECVCPPNLVNCDPILRPWQLSAILLGVFAVVCVVAGVLVIVSQWAPAAVGVKPLLRVQLSESEPLPDDELTAVPVSLVDQATSPPPQPSPLPDPVDDDRESMKSWAPSAYQSIYARSSLIIRPSNVPSRLVDRLDIESVRSDGSDVGEAMETYRTREEANRDERVNDLRKFIQNRKVLSQF